MFNHSDPQSPPDSYVQLLQRMTRRMQQNQVDLKLLESLAQNFERELDRANVTLSRPERLRLFQQVSRVILSDALDKVDRTD